MLARLTIRTATVVAASLLGILTGIVSALVASLPASLLTKGQNLGLVMIPMGALLGLLVGGGIGLLGTRPHSPLAWALVSGSGILLGAWFFRDLATGADIFRHLDVSWLWISIVLAATGALVGWIVVLLNTRALRRRLPSGPVRVWVLLGYLVAFASLAIAFPRLLELIAVGLSY